MAKRRKTTRKAEDRETGPGGLVSHFLLKMSVPPSEPNEVRPFWKAKRMDDKSAGNTATNSVSDQKSDKVAVNCVGRSNRGVVSTCRGALGPHYCVGVGSIFTTALYAFGRDCPHQSV